MYIINNIKLKLLTLLICSFSINFVYAKYNIYLLNNTPLNISINNQCSSRIDGEDCTVVDATSNYLPFIRHNVFSINYDSGMKSGKEYILKSYFKLSADDSNNNFISVDFHGDTIGSHIKSVDSFINGQLHNLLNSNNSSAKVLPDQVGQYSFTYDGIVHTIYASAQHDVASDQGIDNIYLAIDTPYQTFNADNNANTLATITYNIQAFPNYIGAGLDLNKLDTRMDYLSKMARIKNYDVIVFEEAWDHATRDKLMQNLLKDYPYSYDPVPQNDHSVPLYSGLLVLSKYPIVNKKFIDYLDYQSLVDADALSNKGAAYLKINKLGKNYNLIVTHTQAQNDNPAIQVRQEEFNLIKKYLVNDANLAINHNEPLLLIGDLNTDFYTHDQFDYMKNTLDLNDTWIKNTLYTNPIYSDDSQSNLMIDPSINEQGLYDYIIPLNGYLLPDSVKYQVTPMRTLDYAPMYRRSHNVKLYNYGDIEVSDHFMVQAKLYYPE
ncbi:MAG: endonuclease/exonuclease/phosphatase family protein [Burkholderiales bacterium]|nr:endonuclease/exonuclease/phosphatase family protein [Burkholderiales bacterium]